ncbi:MAG: NAD-glutamate dehydrogenase domain-containing protein [Gammaproteobacteria bacterium]
MIAIIEDLAKQAVELSEQNKQNLTHYYHSLHPSDYNNSDAKYLLQCAKTHLALAASKHCDETLIESSSIASPNSAADNTVISVITKDTPFIRDTLIMCINGFGANIIFTHASLLEVGRDKKGNIRHLSPYKKGEGHEDEIESFMQFHLESMSSENVATLMEKMRRRIDAIHYVVSDWPIARDRLLQIADLLSTEKAPASNCDFIRWIENHNFAILGSAEIEQNIAQKIIINTSATGLFRYLLENDQDIAPFIPNLAFGLSSLIVTKLSMTSKIHRSRQMDVIAIHVDGRYYCFVGFLSGTSFNQSVFQVPLIKEKAGRVLERSGLRSTSCNHKAMQNLLESFPRALMFQIKTDRLLQICSSVLSHQERRKTHVYLIKNRCGHFYTSLVYLPRDIFDSELRQKIQQRLHNLFEADFVLFDVRFFDSILCRIEFNIFTQSNTEISEEVLATEVKAIAYDWYAELRHAMQMDGADLSLFNDYQNAFPRTYTNDYGVARGYQDILKLESLSPHNFTTDLFVGSVRSSDSVNFRIYSKDHSLTLSDIVPVFENLGVNVVSEHPYKINTGGSHRITIRNIELLRKDQKDFDLEIDKDRFLQAFEQICMGAIENDGFNQLVLCAGLDVRQANLFRAIYVYLKQINFGYSQNFITNTLTNHIELSRALFALFEAKFDINNKEHVRAQEPIKKGIIERLEAVSSLDEDRVISGYLEVIEAMVRTNYYQDNEDYLCYKIQSKKISFLPKPAPLYEIFMYCARVQGVHLRGGKIARGGLRWSDRSEDFRTEVLGLVKAQQIKNTVIVPVGSKGGFVPRSLPAERDKMLAEGVACYKLFIQSLLDLTDNIVDGVIVPPINVVRHDDDDPYLVVAADKGTASFSDIANEISTNNNFWLGDAFASGGSVGYDHKKMGITARGAWESVKRHFREMGKDIQTEAFSVIGIGDMGGDVFGNGMLLSKHIRLIAAFNHLHIFIDPNPDENVSFTERKRLFTTENTTWQDYDKKLISKGGGVFERSAKSIELSEEAMQALGTTQNKFSPDALINTLLKAPADLFWNGGIGTYVIASDESHLDAQDKANDSTRVKASELRCQVIGEGGNLGMTQNSRIEFDLLGGHCYSDAIDNSAGVDSSDHEVNLKILFSTLETTKRNQVLSSMESEVATLCLQNNYEQSAVISIHTQPNPENLAGQAEAISYLEKAGLLDRELEFLPSKKELKSRLLSSKCLTKPELGVLLAYSKMDFYQNLLDTNLSAGKGLYPHLLSYFPQLVADEYSNLVDSHRLKNEIILTVVVNKIINIMGPVFHIRMHNLTGASYAQIGRAYLISAELLGVDDLLKAIHGLDNKITSRAQYAAIRSLMKVVRANVVWLLNNKSNLDVSTTLNNYQNQYNDVKDSVLKLSRKHLSIKIDKLVEQGLPRALAENIALTTNLYHTLDVIAIAEKCQSSTDDTLSAYLNMSQDLDIRWLSLKINALEVTNAWHASAKFKLQNQLRDVHTRITEVAIDLGSTTQFHQAYAANIERLQLMTQSIKEEEQIDFTTLHVIVGELEGIL